MNMLNISLVALGGALGSVLRFLIARLFSGSFPYGTLAVNYLGCFAIGILMALFTQKTANQEIKLFLITGLMGGLTTFSAFSYETVVLLKEDFTKGLLNISLSLAGCLLLTLAGFKISQFFLLNRMKSFALNLPRKTVSLFCYL